MRNPFKPRALRVDWHEAAAYVETVESDRRRAKVFRRELVALQDALPGWKSYWWKFGGLHFLAGGPFANDQYAHPADPLAAWRETVHRVSMILGRVHKMDVNEYSDASFEAVWILKGYDQNPWWYTGLASNIWPVRMNVTLRMYLKEGDCDVRFVDVTEKRARVSEECKALATSTR